MSNAKELMDEMIAALRPIIRDGVDNVGPDGKIAGKKIAPASYFAVGARLCQSAGVTADSDDANGLLAEIQAATGTNVSGKHPFSPKPIEDDDVE